MGHFIDESLPKMFRHLRLQYSARVVRRGWHDQLKRVTCGHLHRDILGKAFELLRQSKKNCLKTTLRGVGGPVIWYINSGQHPYCPDTNTGEVTRQRIAQYRAMPAEKKVLRLDVFAQRYLSLYAVTVDTVGEDKYRLECTCAGFASTELCSHIVFVYHMLDVIDVMHLYGDLEPVRKRGRPRNFNALQFDDNVEMLAMKPGDIRKTPVRHPEYLNGFVTDYRLKPDKTRTVVWTVRFPDAPGGIQEFEMEEADLSTAIKTYLTWQKEATNIFVAEI